MMVTDADWHDEYEGEWYTDLAHIPDFGKF